MFTLCRLLMLAFNYSAFEDIDLSIFFYALKFDLSAIFFVHSLFIILHIVPLKTRDNTLYIKILHLLFHISNTLSIVFNCIDIEYFKYTGKRSTFDIFSLATTGNDLLGLIPQFLKDFWYIFLLVILLIVLSEYLYRKTKKNNLNPELIQNTLNQSVIGVFCLGLSIVTMRGGLQLKPLRINSAGLYTQAKNIPLILNTPFTILKTISAEYLTEHHYYDDKKLLMYYNPIKTYKAYREDTAKLNVVLIIMESFSKEHVGSLSGKPSATPFLDSLMSSGLVCTNAYANGKKSIDGIPSVVSALPGLMNTPFINSPYIGNKANSLPSLLKSENYNTSFYHGGKNGTMGFDAYSKAAGFEQYFGKNEYRKEEDYDGNWGIFDEPYFSYYADELAKKSQPFFSCIFSLSSHHPYTIPEKHKTKFGNGKQSLPISIQYADFALRAFFTKAKKMSWYENTLFIITADHTGVSDDKFYSNNLGMYQIPILYYRPDGSLKGTYDKTTQQIDILPSVMHYLNYSKPLFCFGQSIFEKENEGFAVNFMNEEYQLITDKYLLKVTAENSISLYEYRKDSLLSNNILKTKASSIDSLERKIKSIVQTYNYSLINNKQAVN